jgi:hypothetical protein
MPSATFPDALPRDTYRRSTRYQVVGSKAGEPPVIVGYTAQRSFPGLMRILQLRGAELIAHCRVTDADSVALTRGRQATLSTAGWVFAFSGRTEHDAATHFFQGRGTP